MENLLKETTHTTYPVVVSREQLYVVGQVLRRDLLVVLRMSNRRERFLRNGDLIDDL